MTAIKEREFLNFLHSLDGRKIATIGELTTFIVSVTGERIQFLLSNGKKRIASRQAIRQVLEIYNNTESLRTTDYLSATQNSSYLLAVLRELDQSRLRSVHNVEAQIENVAKSGEGCARRYFTHYWTYEENAAFANQPLVRIASNQFIKRGVRVSPSD